MPVTRQDIFNIGVPNGELTHPQLDIPDVLDLVSQGLNQAPGLSLGPRQKRAAITVAYFSVG